MNDLQTNLLEKFIIRLKQEKTEVEIDKFMYNLAEFDMIEVYFLMLCFLQDEDLEAIERIDDQKLLEQEIDKRFKARTGFSPREFIEKLVSKYKQ